MSGHGPQYVDYLRLAVQPLLDCIAPECVLNQREVYENRLARMQNQELPILPEQKWQNDFFEKKVRTPLQLEVLDYNCWENDQSPIEKAQDLFHFLFDPQLASPGLCDWISSIHNNALDYIREIKGNVSEKLDASWELNYSEVKAVAAFQRMLNIKMAFNFLDKIKTMTVPDREALLKFIQTKMPVANVEALEAAVQNYIQTQATFSVNQRILFRCHKILQSSVNLEPFAWSQLSSYSQGAKLEEAIQRSKELHTALKDLHLTSTQTTRGVTAGMFFATKTAFVFPGVFLQQCHRLLSQTTRVPFQLISTFMQDIPWVGSFVNQGAMTTNKLKDLGLMTMEGAGLLWLGLLELTRLTGSSPEQNLKDSAMGEMMCAVSPWLRTALAGYAVLSSAGVVSYVGTLIHNAVQKKPALVKNLGQIIIEENMDFFTKHILTEELIEQYGTQVLNFPIDMPETLKTLLSKAEQSAIVETIVQQRQIHYARLKLDYVPQQMHIVQENNLWHPLFQEQLARTGLQEDEEVDDMAKYEENFRLAL